MSENNYWFQFRLKAIKSYIVSEISCVVNGLIPKDKAVNNIMEKIEEWEKLKEIKCKY